MTAQAVALADDRAIEAGRNADVSTDHAPPQGLRQRTLRGAAVSALAQGTGFVLRTGSMFVMARLLFPRDFGLFGMVAAFTGFVGLFRDCGLSMASITRASITQDQLSTLFWINLAVGVALAGLCAAAASLMVTFYGEPRLLLITMVLGVGFVFNGAGAQHLAILLRELKFGTLGVIDTTTLIVGIGLGTGMAARLVAAAPAGMTLVAATVRDRVAADEGVRFGAARRLRLKGFSRPIAAYPLAAVRLAASAKLPSETKVDPVCGMKIQGRRALVASHRGRRFYFCSDTCRRQFRRDQDVPVRGGV